MGASPVREILISAFDGEAFTSRADRVAVEEPLEIRLGKDPLAVVMRTPGQDMALAAGFLRAEAIIRDADDIGTMRHCTEGNDPDFENVVEVGLAEARAQQAEALVAQRAAERAIVTSTSCGVCGKRSIESLHVDAPPFEARVPVPLAHLPAFAERLSTVQAVFEQTGGLHGAAVFDASGELVVAAEDVGRHNAVDKCVGQLLLREQLPLPNATLMVSGRTSFEIVQKALVAGIQTVAAVSAPSSLAVELAEASQMNLIGFLRGGAFNVYVGDVG